MASKYYLNTTQLIIKLSICLIYSFVGILGLKLFSNETSYPYYGFLGLGLVYFLQFIYYKLRPIVEFKGHLLIVRGVRVRQIKVAEITAIEYLKNGNYQLKSKHATISINLHKLKKRAIKDIESKLITQLNTKKTNLFVSRTLNLP